MPKHRHKKYSRGHKRRDRSRDRLPEVMSRESSQGRTSSGEVSLTTRSSSRISLAAAIQELCGFIKQQSGRASQGFPSAPSAGNTQETDSPSPPASEVALPGEVMLSDEQTVLENRGGEPGMFSRNGERGNITDCSSASLSLQRFSVVAVPQETDTSDSRVAFLDPPPLSSEEKEPSLAETLFNKIGTASSTASWNRIVLDSTKSKVSSGLEDETRQSLLAKYEPKGDLSFLNPPKINKELIAALAKRQSTIKRDEYQTKSQAQVAASLNAFASGVSDLLSQQDLLDDSRLKASLTKLADGIQLLADHHYRLSLSRQAFIKPCLSFVGKTAADSSTVDNWLFGSGFAEDFKSAQACEKAARDLVRSGSTITQGLKSKSQAAQAAPQQRATKRPGNVRTSASHAQSSARQPRSTHRPSRSHSGGYRSRSRPRR